MGPQISNRERANYEEAWHQWCLKHPHLNNSLGDFIERIVKKPEPVTNAQRAVADSSWTLFRDQHPECELSLEEFVRCKNGEITLREIEETATSGENQEYPYPDGYGPSAPTPKGLRYPLHTHQRKALYWLHHGEGGKILADDMGLGKTLEVLAFLVSLSQTNKIHTALVILPASLLSLWESEIKKHIQLEDFTVLRVDTGKQALEYSWNEFQSFNIVLTTKALIYNQVESYRTALKNSSAKSIPKKGWSFLGIMDLNLPTEIRPWPCAVLDEAHDIRNDKNKISSALCQYIKAHKKLALTGTPIQNDPRDLFALLRWIEHKEYGKDVNKFLVDAVNPAKLHGDYTVIRKIITTCLLRRQKDHLINGKLIVSLKPKRTIVHHCSFDSSEQELWDHFFQLAQRDFNLFQSLRTIPRKDSETKRRVKMLFVNILESILRMRQLSVEPALLLNIPGDGRISGHFLQLLRSRRAPPAKTRTTLAIVKTVITQDQNAKILIFSEWKGHLKLVQKHLEQQGYKFYMYGGWLTLEERNKIITQFKTTKCQGMLLTLGSGGVGLNLVEAYHVIMLTPSWNPQRDHQAEDRVYRIGQTQEVVIHKLIVPGTVESRIMAKQRNKEQYHKKTLLSGADDLGENEERPLDARNVGVGINDLIAIFDVSRKASGGDTGSDFDFWEGDFPEEDEDEMVQDADDAGEEAWNNGAIDMEI